MKLGSPDWLKRERDWLLEDIEQQLGIVEELRLSKIAREWLLDEQTELGRLRYKLKLLRENPREYVSQTKKQLS